MVRKYIPKRTRTQTVDEDSMKSAMQEVVQGLLSYRKAAEKYNVRPSTLESRIKTYKKTKDVASTKRTFNSKFTSVQVFSVKEEKLLLNFISKRCKKHQQLTTVRLRKLAYDFAKSMNLKHPANWKQNKMAGKDWMYGFRKRNPDLILRIPENASVVRVCNNTSVAEFYCNLKTFLKRHSFPAHRIYNFHHLDVSTFLPSYRLVTLRNENQVGENVSSEEDEIVTFGGIISASGNTIPPLFVFPRLLFKKYFLEGAPEGSLGAANGTGSMTSAIFISVLQHIETHTLCTKQNPILLICDYQEGHFGLEASNYAKDSGIFLLCFPPHASHRLNPLDVGVFGPFKTKLRIAFNNWHIMNPDKTLSINDIPKLVKIAYFESFTIKNITSGFSTPGIWPLNELAFSDEDFPQKEHASGTVESTPSNQNIIEDLATPTPQVIDYDMGQSSLDNNVTEHIATRTPQLIVYDIDQSSLDQIVTEDIANRALQTLDDDIRQLPPNQNITEDIATHAPQLILYDIGQSSLDQNVTEDIATPAPQLIVDGIRQPSSNQDITEDIATRTPQLIVYDIDQSSLDQIVTEDIVNRALQILDDDIRQLPPNQNITEDIATRTPQLIVYDIGQSSLDQNVIEDIATRTPQLIDDDIGQSTLDQNVTEDIATPAPQLIDDDIGQSTLDQNVTEYIATRTPPLMVNDIDQSSLDQNITEDMETLTPKLIVVEITLPWPDQNITEDLATPTPQVVSDDISQPSSSATQVFSEVPQDSGSQTITTCNSQIEIAACELRSSGTNTEDGSDNPPFHHIVTLKIEELDEDATDVFN